MRTCLGALVPGGACSLGNPLCLTVVRDGAKKLDTGNGTESTAFRDSSGTVTNEAGVLGIPEWLIQCAQDSTGCSNALAKTPSLNTGGANGLGTSTEAVSSIGMSSIGIPSIGMSSIAMS